MTLEEAQDLILKLKEEKKALEVKNIDYANKEKETEKRITELQEHNQKLFLKLTTEPETEGEEEGEKAPSIEELSEKILKGEL
jgi:ribosomal silencing factor RsfS